MTRKANTICKICYKPIYRRPFEIESYGANLYCSKVCMYKDRTKTGKCPICNKEFNLTHPKQIYCSKVCSGKSTRNRLGTKKGYRKQKNSSEARLEQLKNEFKTCMIEGCTYDICFDVHRLVDGQYGGKYEIGNMFAICPNHHAEITRKIIKVEKVNDCLLRKSILPEI